MNQRSVANPTISFGLISIPTKAYITASEDKFSFVWISPKGNRVSTKTIDKATGEEVARSDIRNAVEVEKDRFVVFSDEELDDLAGDQSNIIEINEVVAANKISLLPSKVERTLSLSPDKSDKSYRLFARCLEKKKAVAVGTWYYRSKDNLVAIVGSKDKLTMHQLYYSNELRDYEVVFAAGSDPTGEEIALGIELLTKYSSEEFHLDGYKNEFKCRVEAAAIKKSTGKGVLKPKRGEVKGLDLATLLSRSMNETKRQKTG